MSKNWTKRECKRLLAGHSSKLRSWIREYAGILYTWILYHYPVTPSQAKEWILRIFQEAHGKLNEYDPSAGSMYEWLIACAKLLYPPGEQSGLEALWRTGDRLDSEDLRTVTMISVQDLPDHLLEIPAFIQLIQAAITDMDESQRRVLLTRYYRIDQSPLFEYDFEYTSDSMYDQLMRARYYFRRNLFAWIHSLEPETGEFMSDSRIQIFEKNLEKIFCSVPPFQKLPEEFLKDLEAVLLEQIRQVQPYDQTGSKISLRLVWIAAGAMLILVVGAGTYLLIGKEAVPEPASPSSQTVQDREPESAGATVVDQEMTAEELERILTRIFNAGSEGRIDELILALEQGPYPAQIAAAMILMRIGDESAIDALEKAAQQRYPDSLQENPFLDAIEQIESRLRQQAEEANEGTEEFEGEQLEAWIEEPELPSEANSIPPEPNLSRVFGGREQGPVEVNEISLETHSVGEMPDPNSFEEIPGIYDSNDLLPEIDDSNLIDVEVYDDLSTMEVDYIE